MAKKKIVTRVQRKIEHIRKEEKKKPKKTRRTMNQILGKAYGIMRRKKK